MGGKGNYENTPTLNENGLMTDGGNWTFHLTFTGVKTSENCESRNTAPPANYIFLLNYIKISGLQFLVSPYLQQCFQSSSNLNFWLVKCMTFKTYISRRSSSLFLCRLCMKYKPDLYIYICCQRQGNGHILPGQTWCLIHSLVSVWSSPLYDVSVCPLMTSATALGYADF